MSNLDTQRLAILMKTKRAHRSLREVAREIEGVSLSTLSRIENGKTPDMATFLRVCDWLQVAPTELTGCTDVSMVQGITVMEQIEILLRGSLPVDLADAFVALLKATYKRLEE